MPHNAFMVADLARSGLTPNDLVSVASSNPYAPNSSKYRIPYWNTDGTPHPTMWRDRLQHPAPDSGKYSQPSAAALPNAAPGDLTFPYFNPTILGGATWDYLVANRRPGGNLWAFVEGEKKAVCVGKYAGRAAIGFGGCWNGLVADANGVYHLHPALPPIMLPGDRVEVIFDADLYTNSQVERAAGTLRRALLRRGVLPTFVLVPKGVKGIDDWLVTIPLNDRAAMYERLPRALFDRGELQEDRTTFFDAFRLPVSAKGVVTTSEATALAILKQHERYVNRVWIEDSTVQMMQAVGGPEPRPTTDAFIPAQLIWFQSHVSQGFKPAHITGAFRALANSDAHHRNAVHEYINGLKWDGTPRLETMFIRGFGATDDPYTRGVGGVWLLSVVARAMKPGCKVDTMLVLEGAQGIGKSRALSALGGPWYVEITTKMDSKDFLLAAHRSLILDLAEMGSYKYADFAFVKGLLSTAIDALRVPYGSVVENLPRRFVVVGTTNEKNYLRDQTGNRRFWPIACGTIDVDWIAANRDQLFAEAKMLYDAGTQWWLPDALTAAAQDQRVSIDPWEEMVDRILITARTGTPIVLKGVAYNFIPSSVIMTTLGVSNPNVGHYSRLADVMSKHFKEWEEYRYGNPANPINVAGVMQTQVRGYRALVQSAHVSAAPAASVTPIVPIPPAQVAPPPPGNPFAAPDGAGGTKQ